MSFRDVIDELPDALAQEARLVADSADDVEKQNGQWVPYQGPQGGEGWRNTETGDIEYQEQPPGELDTNVLSDAQIEQLQQEIDVRDDNAISADDDPEEYIRENYPEVETVEMHRTGFATEQLSLDKLVIEEENRGTGVGSAVMEDLVTYAERADEILTLSPNPDFDEDDMQEYSVEALKDWYKQYDFVENEGENRAPNIMNTMYRVPEGKEVDTVDFS